MTPSGETDLTPPIPFDEVSASALALAAAPDLPAMASRFLSKLQSWATPNLVVCVVKDAAADAGWRTIPELTSGAIPAGAERSLAKLLEESPPESLTRPLRVRPADDVPGFKVRDTWIVPWSYASASGFLVLRGIPRPHASNLGEAVALLSQPLWPRLCGSGASGISGPGVAAGGENDRARLVGLIAEAQRVAERLGAELLQGLETLRAPTPAPASSSPALEADLEAARRHVTTVEEQLGARDEALRGSEEKLRALEEKARASEEKGQATEEKLRAGEEKLQAAEEKVRAAEGKRDQAQAEVAALAARTEAAEKARSEAEAEREFARGEAVELRGQLAALEKKLEERGTHHAELDQVRNQLAAAQQKADAAEKARAAAEAERDGAKVQLNQLWASLESLQRQVEIDKDAGKTRDREVQDAVAAKAAAEHERDEAKAAFGASLQRVKQAEAQERFLGERWEKTSGAFRSALEALKRTPFVPPTLRVSLAEAERFLENQEARVAARLGRALFLDRDMAALERLALDLEVAGVEVLIAHYPEEVTFFLKTPDSRGLSAVVCDVMAFRSDQNLSELLKTWRQDSPSLNVYLSFKADNPTEAERAQRIPTLLTAGYLPRPLQKEALLDAFQQFSRRPGKR